MWLANPPRAVGLGRRLAERELLELPFVVLALEGVHPRSARGTELFVSHHRTTVVADVSCHRISVGDRYCATAMYLSTITVAEPWTPGSYLAAALMAAGVLWLVWRYVDRGR